MSDKDWVVVKELAKELGRDLSGFLRFLHRENIGIGTAKDPTKYRGQPVKIISKADADHMREIFKGGFRVVTPPTPPQKKGKALTKPHVVTDDASKK